MRPQQRSDRIATGKKIFPEEIERHFDASPLIAESALTESPPGRLTVLVVPAEELANLSPEERAAQIHEETTRITHQLPTHARPKSTQIIPDPLPRTRLGKLRRHLLPTKNI